MKLNFFASSKRNLRNNFDLLRIKIFNFHHLKWFLLSVITISSLFTISSAFLLGFQNQSLFTDNPANNVLVISQPNITPAQSHIPLFWVEDIQQLPGISAISPETVDIVIDHTNGQTPYFRGVTTNYQKILPDFTMQQGKFFGIDNTTKNEVIVGSNYAKLFNVHVGDNLVLQSRIQTVIIDVQVTGIFNSHNIADDGILGPLWLGRLFTGLTNDLVNLIQIKFNPAIYSKAELESIILGNHLLTVTVTNPYNYNLDISKSKVELYNRYKTIINQSLVDSNNKVYFTIPFGKYYLKLVHPDLSTSSFVSIFITKDNTFNLILGTQYANFTAKFSISNEVKQNAKISILNQDLGKVYNYTTNNNGIISAGIPLGALMISFTWKNYQNTTLFNHQAAENVNINFDYQVTLTLLDPMTNSTLAGKEILIKNLENNQNITINSNNNGNIVENLQPDTAYILISNNPNYNRSLYVNSFNDSTFNLFLGKVSTSIQFIDIDHGLLKNLPVNLTLMSPNSNGTPIITNEVTNDTGMIQLNTMSGTIVTIKTNYGPLNELFEKKFIVENNRSVLFYAGKQDFYISVKKNTNSLNSLFPLNVVFQDVNSSNNFNFVLNANSPYKVFLNYGYYSISATNNKYSYFNDYNFNLTSAHKFVINFNLFKINVTFFTKNNTLFTGNFQLMQKINQNYSPINNFIGSNLVIKLQDGIYRLDLQNTNYDFSTNLIITNENIVRDYYVSQKSPIINPQDFANFSIINSTQKLFVSLFNTKNVQYAWDNNSFQNYIDSVGIIPLSTDGIHVLTFKIENYDNVQVLEKYIITIDNTGPIITLLNKHGNNSIINYNLLPIFSFSEHLKLVQYSWNTTVNTTLYPTPIPTNSIGWKKLTVTAEDYADNTNIFFFIFYFDNSTPTLTNFNSLNNSIIYSNTISLVFSKPLAQVYYYWSNNLAGIIYNPASYTNVSIAAPNRDGNAINLTVDFVDLAGNSNHAVLTFPYVDQFRPVFSLSNGTYNNEVFDQINNSKIFFTTFNTNNTIFYRWNQSAPKILYTNNLYQYYLQVPFKNGSLTLQVSIYDEYNKNDNLTYLYNFTGQFYSPQFNVTLSDPLGPNQLIKILFPFSFQNWSAKWNNITNKTGTSKVTTINAPPVLGYQQLELLFYYTNNSFSTLKYNFTVANAAPSLTNKNITILSQYNTYILTFPNYVSKWNYTWNNITFYSGNNLTTTLINVFSSGFHNLSINYTTIYGNYSHFNLTFQFDSSIPSASLTNGKDYSHKRSVYIPTFAFSEKLRQVFYSWDGLVNTTQPIAMPKSAENTLHNLTIYMEDYGNNWNITTFSFYQDNIPILLSLNPSNATINNKYVKPGQTILFETNETPALITCSWNSQTPYNCALTVPVINFQGKITFIIRVYDEAGNSNAYSLALYSDTTAPVLVSSTLANNTVINTNFVLSYSFSEPVSASNSIFAWDSFGNVSGFPTINKTLIGLHVLHWWFSDNQSNWNSYTFNVYIHTGVPSFIITGNYSSSVLIANSSLFVIPNSQNMYPLSIYAQWGSDHIQTFDVNSNSSVNLPLPNIIGSSLLHLQIRDFYNNWNNQTLSFEIEPYFSITLLSTQNIPVIPLNLILLNDQTQNQTLLIKNSNFLSSLVSPGNYTLIINFPSYNLSTTFDLHSTSVTRRFILKNLIVNFTSNLKNSTLSGLISWQNSILTSTKLIVNGSTSIYSLTSSTNFYAKINNESLERTLDLSQNINLVNFTLSSVNLFLKVQSSSQSIPISNAVIKVNQSILGLTNQQGIFSKQLNPGSYNVAVYYSNFNYNFSIQIFENQNYTINLAIYANITILVQNNDLSSAEYIPVNLYNSNSVLIKSGLTDFNGQVSWNFIPWGTYRIEIKTNSSTFEYNISIGSLSDQKNNIFSYNIPTSNIVSLTGSNNLGKWTFNRDYQILTPSALSDKTLNNLGFSVIFLILFLIISSMTIMGLISLLHQPIYRLKETILILTNIGTSKDQVLEIVSIQFGILTFFLSLIGYFFGWLTLQFWPSLQQLPIAGMIIIPQIENLLIPTILCLSFSVISMIFAHRYTNREYFASKIIS